MTAIPQLLEESVKKYSRNVYLWEKKEDSYEPLTYSEVKDLVYNFGAGLMKIGVKKGDRIALLSEGRNEWIIGELGILCIGAINVPLSVKLNEPSEILFRLEHSGARMFIVSNHQAKKLETVKNKLPDLEKIIFIDNKETFSANEIYFYDIVKLGEKFLKDNVDEFIQRKNAVLPGDYATISYTSGTTSDPKGIILTHRNYTANVEQALNLIDLPDNYVSLLILPLDHSFAHTACIYAVMKSGASVASVQIGKTAMETLKNIPVNIKEIRPHFLLSVPALAKNFRKNIESAVYKKGRFVLWLFNLCLKTGYIYNGNVYDKRKGWKILLKPLNSFFDFIIFKKVRENFGGRMKFFVGGGALLDIELQRFFYAVGIPMLQGYGLTEASPVISANSLKKHKLGTSGTIVKPLDLLICDENRNPLHEGEKGEIVIRGENVMAGYWRNTEATNQTIIDGWLHTGDLGYLDEDGFLYVLGRFKSLLIGDDGEKFSPESIEEAIVGHSAYIDQCMLYNNQNPYTVALVVPNKESLKRWIKEKHHHEYSEEINIQLLKLIESEISEYRTGRKYGNMFPQRWLPVSIAITEESFSEENQLLNSTLKLVRGKVTERYEEKIKFLYTPESKNIANAMNLKAISKILE